MKTYLKFFFSVIFTTVIIGLPAQAAKAPSFYNYANDESEYSVVLPEAPTIKTIWKESEETLPYMSNAPSDGGALGEVATFKRVDIDTEEVFDVKITFLKATPAFLEGLTAQKIQTMLEALYKTAPLSNGKFSLSTGTGTLKWATLSGFTLDPHHHPALSAVHYLTGQQSIIVVQVLYSLENKTFQGYYDRLVGSITYNPP